jgi:hypothetical protein
MFEKQLDLGKLLVGIKRVNHMRGYIAQAVIVGGGAGGGGGL